MKIEGPSRPVVCLGDSIDPLVCPLHSKCTGPGEAKTLAERVQHCERIFEGEMGDLRDLHDMGDDVHEDWYKAKKTGVV